MRYFSLETGWGIFQILCRQTRFVLSNNRVYDRVYGIQYSHFFPLKKPIVSNEKPSTFVKRPWIISKKLVFWIKNCKILGVEILSILKNVGNSGFLVDPMYIH